MEVKAIDTFYNGNYFRSRLEARWAVFFDTAGIKYQYEPQGFALGSGRRYLPDFYLTDFSCYVEIKPDIGNVYDQNSYDLKMADWCAIRDHEDFDKWDEFCCEYDLIILFGNPNNRPFWLMRPVDREKVGFHLETKGKNEVNGKKVPFWRFWYCCGDEIFDDLNPHIEKSIKTRFEHKK